MFNKPTLVIIGAGASHEYELPLGSTLKSNIAQRIRFRFEQFSGRLNSGDYKLLDHIRRRYPDRATQNEFTRAAGRLSDAIGSFISIDEALHFVGDSTQAVEVGKIAIIDEILLAERESTLRIDPAIGRADVVDVGGWMSHFFSMALAGIQRTELGKAFEKIMFVNFNYDRSLEHYVFSMLQQSAGATQAEAAAIVNGLNVVRPYGSLGPLDWQQPRGTPYGYSGHLDPFSLAGGIRTYTEKKPMHDAAKVQQFASQADLFLFLGFGFHAQNVDLLKIPQRTNSGRVEMLASVFGIHRETVPTIRYRVCANLQLDTGLASLLDMKAAELLRDLRQRILILVE